MRERLIENFNTRTNAYWRKFAFIHGQKFQLFHYLRIAAWHRRMLYFTSLSLTTIRAK
jgi:hypothetical protein